MARPASPPLHTLAPSPMILQCPPIYVPDAGGEEIDLENHTGTFYAVVTEDWKGVAISECVPFPFFASLLLTI